MDEMNRERLKELTGRLRSAIRSPHHPSPKARKAQGLFLSDLKWNVLVIDNEIGAEGRPADCSLYPLLGYPDEAFWRTINPIPYYPEPLLSPAGSVKEFLTDLRYRLYRYDVDMVLLDVSLTSPNPGDQSLKEYHGFNFLDEIKKQALELGRPDLPVVMFTKHIEETPFMIASLKRGAWWYAKKEVPQDESPLPRIRNLPEIIEVMYSPWLWLEEYKQRDLAEWQGPPEIRRRLEKALDRLENDAGWTDTIDQAEFALRDPFFGEGFPANSFRHVLEACSKQRTCDLRKLIEYHYIFRRLFAGFDRIKVLKKADPGLSRADVFFVLPYKGEMEYSVQTVKIGPYAEIEKERYNFEGWINGVLDSFIGRIKAGPIRADTYAGLLYVAIGIKADYKEEEGKSPISLKRLIELALEGSPFQEMPISLEKVKEFLENLFTNVLDPFYRPAQPVGREWWRLISAYIEDLPSMLSGELGEICPDPEQIEKYGEVVKVKKLEDILGVGNTCLLQDFEIYEVDRLNRKLKLYNKPHYFEVQDASSIDTEFQDWALKRTSRLVDLRVDVEVPRGQAQQLFTDPRIGQGKRLSLVIRHPESLWKGDRLHFLKVQPHLELAAACCKAIDEIVQGCYQQQNRYWLINEFENLVSKGILTAFKALKVSIIHGDLNLENILVTLSGQNLLGWFIDFSRSRFGHTAFDFVKLETEIKTQLLSKYLSKLISEMQLQGEGEPVMRCLEWFHSFEEEGVIENSKSQPLSRFAAWKQVRELASLVLLIRHLASRYDLGGEYNWALFFYSFTALKFTNLDEPKMAAPLPKCLAYLAACAAYRKLERTDPLLAQERIFSRNLKATHSGSSLCKEQLLIEAYRENPAEQGWMLAFLETLRERDLNVDEIAMFAREIAASGQLLCWDSSYVTIDIPSTGGTGSKVPILVPAIVIAAARRLTSNQLIIPKMSSRGIPAGTIDVLESVGYQAEISLRRYQRIVSEVGLSNIAPTRELAPMDKWLMELRGRRRTRMMRRADLTVASILGKKLAIGCRRLIVEIKAGAETKMRFADRRVPEQAVRDGAKLFIEVGEKLGIEVRCLITDGNRPQGKYIGPLLALKEAVDLLKGNVDEELKQLCVEAAAEMLNLGLGWELGQARQEAEKSLSSGEAFKVFRAWLTAHGVDWKNVETRLADLEKKDYKPVLADQSGYVAGIDVDLVDKAAIRLIAPKNKIEHYMAGLEILQLGESVHKGEEIAMIYCDDEWQAEIARHLVQKAYRITDQAARRSYLKYKVWREGDVIKYASWDSFKGDWGDPQALQMG